MTIVLNTPESNVSATFEAFDKAAASLGAAEFKFAAEEQKHREKTSKLIEKMKPAIKEYCESIGLLSDKQDPVDKELCEQIRFAFMARVLNRLFESQDAANAKLAAAGKDKECIDLLACFVRAANGSTVTFDNLSGYEFQKFHEKVHGFHNLAKHKEFGPVLGKSLANVWRKLGDAFNDLGYRLKTNKAPTKDEKPKDSTEDVDGKKAKADAEKAVGFTTWQNAITEQRPDAAQVLAHLASIGLLDAPVYAAVNEILAGRYEMTTA